MHTISSYRGNRPTHKHTNAQTHVTQTGPITIGHTALCTLYTAPQLSAQCKDSRNLIAQDDMHV